jgi:hypothetical protein
MECFFVPRISIFSNDDFYLIGLPGLRILMQIAFFASFDEERFSSKSGFLRKSRGGKGSFSRGFRGVAFSLCSIRSNFHFFCLLRASTSNLSRKTRFFWPTFSRSRLELIAAIPNNFEIGKHRGGRIGYAYHCFGHDRAVFVYCLIFQKTFRSHDERK